MTDKKPEFVVSDRRRFVPENESRTDAPAAEEERGAPVSLASSVAEPQVAENQVAENQVAENRVVERQISPRAEGRPSAGPVEVPEEEMPPPPTPLEQQQQDEAYKASSKKIDAMIDQAGARGEAPGTMSFEALIESFYMSALVQIGAVRREGEQPRVDIIGARQTIDTISLLQEKTKGNLTGREQALLQNVLFELRMAWIEITNAIAKAPAPAPGAGFPGGLAK